MIQGVEFADIAVIELRSPSAASEPVRGYNGPVVRLGGALLTQRDDMRPSHGELGCRTIDERDSNP